MNRFLVLIALFFFAAVVAAQSDPIAKLDLDIAKKKQDLEALRIKQSLAPKEKDGKKKKMKEERSPSGMKVFHHVHHSVASKDIKPRMKFPKMVSPGAWGADDVEQERLDQLEKKENGPQPNANVVAYEQKYQKILAEVINDLGVTMQTPTYVVLKEVEKRMEESEKKKHVKTSTRMMAHMKRMLAKLYEKYEEEDKPLDQEYGVKEFVSNVFGKYRLRHEEEQERMRRIKSLSKHIDKKHNKNEHRLDFHDNFYSPVFSGYDKTTNIPLHSYSPLEDPVKEGEHKYPYPYIDEVTQEPPTQLNSTPYVRKPGFFPRMWTSVKGWFNA